MYLIVKLSVMDLLEETKNREIEYNTVMSVFVTWTNYSKYEVLQNKLPATRFTLILHLIYVYPRTLATLLKYAPCNVRSLNTDTGV